MEAQIDDELYDKLYECMLDRLKDKWPVVRYHAVMAMSRLQDPSDENCPVIKGEYGNLFFIVKLSDIVFIKNLKARKSLYFSVF